MDQTRHSRYCLLWLGHEHGLTLVCIFFKSGQSILFLPDITSTLLTRGYTSFTALLLSPELKTYCGFLQSTKADTSWSQLLYLCIVTLQNRKKYSKRETQSLEYEEVNFILLCIYTHTYRITESFSLEKAFKLIKSNSFLSTAKLTINSYLQVSHLHIF